jgi:hypothetical protein
VLIRSRSLVPWALLALCALTVQAPRAWAAAEFHKLNLLLSSNPASLANNDYKGFINDYNRRYLESRGLEGLDKVQFAWLHEAEVRYFIAPNIAFGAGVGQMRSLSRNEYLPRLSQRIEIRTSILSVPIHAGATYYAAPFNQGDFRARAYIGAGIMSVTSTKVFFEQLEENTDTTTTLGGSYRFKGRGDAPGYYAEIGAHMWFATRLSLMLGATYRSVKVRNLRYEGELIREGGNTPYVPALRPKSLDFSGIGARFALLIGL